MLIEEVLLADATDRGGTLCAIVVSDLRPGRRGDRAPAARLSTRLRARRYVASLLTLALVALSLMPGAGMGLLGAPPLTPASARNAPPAYAPNQGGDRLAMWPRAPRPPRGTGAPTDGAVRRGNQTPR